jgi:hypothetical protein
MRHPVIRKIRSISQKNACEAAKHVAGLATHDAGGGSPIFTVAVQWIGYAESYEADDHRSDGSAREQSWNFILQL